MEVVEKVVEIQSWHNINILSRNCLKWLILSDSGSEGWGFESLRAYHKNNHTFRCGYFYGYREDFTCPAEVNSACTKVLAFGQNTCTAQKRRGPEGRFSEMLYLFRMHMPKSRLSAAAESLLFV
ncbi:hypothetical protein [Flavonifractor plautii]|uniref:hypothetical protein n=1 Tax=Flavonifractor plautii TaxID=292800 RepID=UPI0035198498